MFAFFDPSMAPTRTHHRPHGHHNPVYQQCHQQLDPLNIFTSLLPSFDDDESDEEERLLRQALARKQQERQARQRYQLRLQREREQQLAAERQRQRQLEILRAKAIAEYEAEQQRRLREYHIQQEQLRRQRAAEAQRRAVIEEVFRRQLAIQKEREEEERRRQHAVAAQKAAKARAIAEAKAREEAKKRQEQQRLKQLADSQSVSETEVGDFLEDIIETFFFPQLKRHATDRSHEQQPSKRVSRHSTDEQLRTAEQAKKEAKTAADVKKKKEEEQKRKTAMTDSDDDNLAHSYFIANPEMKEFVESILGAKIVTPASYQSTPTSSFSSRSSSAASSSKATVTPTKKVTIETPKDTQTKPATSPASSASQSPASSPELRATDILRERQERQRKQELSLLEKHSELNEIESILNGLAIELEAAVHTPSDNKNKTAQVEENVTKTMFRIDSVPSEGDLSIRKRRKELIKKSQELLDTIDNHKNKARNTGKQPVKKSLATTVADAPETPAVEETEEFSTPDAFPEDVSASDETVVPYVVVDTPSAPSTEPVESSESEQVEPIEQAESAESVESTATVVMEIKQAEDTHESDKTDGDEEQREDAAPLVDLEVAEVTGEVSEIEPLPDILPDIQFDTEVDQKDVTTEVASTEEREATKSIVTHDETTTTSGELTEQQAVEESTETTLIESAGSDDIATETIQPNQSESLDHDFELIAAH